ncbi:hypothetical protein, partial [Mycobacterium tuberculosis]|uniref:hypothetical protein n=1 Tax=Mycobacterium tuberculosis TaxID=1773 RepID=UPI000AF7281D
RHLDLVTAPFTLPRSRVLVFREGDGVRVHTSEYERRLAECRVLDELTVVDATGAVLPVTDVTPARVVFGGSATLTFADPSTLSIGDAPGGRIRIRRPDASVEEHPLDDDGLLLRIGEDRSVVVGSGGHAQALAATEAIWAAWFARCPVVRD